MIWTLYCLHSTVTYRYAPLQVAPLPLSLSIDDLDAHVTPMLDAEQRKEATGGGGADAGAAFRAELQALKAQLEAAQAVTWWLHGGYMMGTWR